MKIKNYASGALFLFAVTTIPAVSAKSFDAISFTVLNQRIAMPGQGIFSDWNPGFALGAERVYLSNRHCSLYQSIATGFYRHPTYGGELNINTMLGIRYHVKHFFAELKLGPGYALQRPQQQHFKQIDIGEYRVQKWTHKLTAGGGLSAGLLLGRYGIALGWNVNVVYPYLKQESIILSRQYFELSFRYKLSRIK